MKKAVAWMLALAMAFGTVGCGESSTGITTGETAQKESTDAAETETVEETETATEENLHFVYVSPLLSHPTWLKAKEGFDQACSELGITGDWVGPQGVSVEEMAQLVDTAVAQKAYGIITQSI